MTDDAPHPLKRHTTLQPLSREHMSGLVLARNLVSAAERGAERGTIAAMLSHAWEGELAPHFADEEAMLLPLVDAAMGERLVREHRELERRIRDVIRETGELAAADVVTIAELLVAHIRWEERTLFEVAQAVGGAGLDLMGHEAERIHSERPGSRPRTRLDQGEGPEQGQPSR
jgi:hemerythrin-like domain-containing protein